MKNYFYIDGKKIPMSDETAESILKNIDSKPKTYEELAAELFEYGAYFTASNGLISSISRPESSYTDPNNATTDKQLESILNLNKLLNVAKYLNGNKKVKDFTEYWHICPYKLKPRRAANALIRELIYFQSEEDAEYAIDILGKDAIKSALRLQK